jgi:hypothetical protein
LILVGAGKTASNARSLPLAKTSQDPVLDPFLPQKVIAPIDFLRILYAPFCFSMAESFGFPNAVKTF